MSGKEKRIALRVSPGFKSNMIDFVAVLYEYGFRDDGELSNYTREALIEKRARDLEKLKDIDTNNTTHKPGCGCQTSKMVAGID